MRCSGSMCHIIPFHYKFTAMKDFSPLMRWLSDKLVPYSVARDVDGQNRVIALVSGEMAPNWNESWRLEPHWLRSSSNGKKGQTSSMGEQIKRTQTKKTGETQASIKGVCVWAAGGDTRVSKWVRKALVFSVMSWMSVIFCGCKFSLASAWEASSAHLGPCHCFFKA